MRGSWQPFLACWVTSLLFYESVVAETVTTTKDHGRNLIEWLQAHGGYFNPKLEIRQADPTDADSHYGVFTSEDLDEDELLVRIPDECKLTSEMEEPDWVCTTTRNLHREMLLGDESKWAPFVNYLKDQPQGQLPSAWSEEGLDLLFKVTGGSMGDDSQIIPPSGPAGWLKDEWANECNGSDDPYEQHVFLLVIQRGWDDILLPIFDMINHRNGHWFNTKSNSVRDNGVDIEIKAKRPVKSGEELYGSYDECEDCGGRLKTYGTPEIFRDYGFVELFPQKWIFHDQGIAFRLDEARNGELILEWLDENAEPGDDEMDFFEDQVIRLTNLLESDLSENDGSVPQNEFATIVEFTEATIRAMDKLLSVVKGLDCNPQEGTCKVSPRRYSQLNEQYTSYDITTCDRSISLDYSKYEIIDNVKSLYQAQEWIKSPDHRNVCFDLDDIYQQCTSYRPHYHEVFVHYTARFLPEIKRVLWVGGGDGMLLHEMLKYPSLELAIGLELDQKVTRWSFKHFGSQPHWDNDKVQWWYGDAAKSLLMLPKEYFGSFDLVLVDLSETVMSMKVTKELDIMAALSLLIKPDGIFVKNELYFEKLNHLFKHTIQVQYYDVPAICSQTMVFGSNAVDFIHTNLTDHGVETLFSQLDDLDTKFDLVHDYKNNPEAKRLCKEEQEEKEPEEQEASPGIVMIVEVENTMEGLITPDEIEKAVTPALEAKNLHVMQTIKSGSGDKPVFVTVMEEGYIVARSWPAHQYCAFDIHLWTKFDEQDSIKSELMKAVGGRTESTSAFRIVAGGIFGIEGWLNDYKSVGPIYTQECNEPVEPIRQPMEEKLVHSLVSKTMNEFVKDDAAPCLVVCGPDSLSCGMAKIASDIASIGSTLVLPTCSSIDIATQSKEDIANFQYACETEVVEKMETFVASSGKIGAMLINPDVSFQMLQVLNKVLSRRRYVDSFLVEKGPSIVAPILDPTQKWRKFFLDHFRSIYDEDSEAHISEIVYNTTDSTIELATFSSSNGDFMMEMEGFVQSVKDDTGIVGEIRLLSEGRFDWQGDDWMPSQFFGPEAYDQTDPLAQWMSQQPTGHQAVIQLMAKKESEITKSDVKTLLESALSKLEIEATTQEFPDLGDGAVVVSLWSEGHVVVLFDGRSNISINLFIYEEDLEFAETFYNSFQEDNESLSLALYDEMPRGYGRVVNWSNDIGERESRIGHTIWATLPLTVKSKSSEPHFSFCLKC